jgi:hypothetical protein
VLVRGMCSQAFGECAAAGPPRQACYCSPLEPPPVYRDRSASDMMDPPKGFPPHAWPLIALTQNMSASSAACFTHRYRDSFVQRKVCRGLGTIASASIRETLVVVWCTPHARPHTQIGPLACVQVPHLCGAHSHCMTCGSFQLLLV